MELIEAAQMWHTDGFVVLPAFIPADELDPAVRELPTQFPTAEGFHDGTDPRRDRYIGDEFAGIDTFPFTSTELSLLAVNERLRELASTLLGDDDIHMYAAESWAKYTGACDYDQDLHRDYLNHTILVPSTAPGCRQVEMFVYLTDVRAAGDSILAYAFSESARVENSYPVGTLADAPNPAAARAFVDLVLSDVGQQLLADAGFLPPS